MLFFETVLRAGLVPVNIRYNRLFASAPISLALMDEDGAHSAFLPRRGSRLALCLEAAAHGYGAPAAPG